MKRKVTLYIGGQPVDLDNDGLILFNWTMEDLTNPTTVKNSYSQTLAIKGTPRNNRIFGESFRTDRMISPTGTSSAGVLFDPTRKTPFQIFDEQSEVLESGYVKLDSVQVSGQGVTYNVTLYGGLGSFFYSLTYDSQGNKRTLADLDYLGSDDPDSELNFIITARNVQLAWNTLAQGSSGRWQVVNFAPCYNGIPDGDFSADKAIASPSVVGLPDEQTVDGKKYSPKNGRVLVNLAQKHDEWAVKDLRSYLQRPVFSIKAFMDAICKPENNGGYTVDVSSLEDSDGTPFYNDIWMTLPMLTNLNLAQTSVEAEMTGPVSSLGTSAQIATYNISYSGSVASNTSVAAEVNLRLYLQGNAQNAPALSTTQNYPESFHYDTVIFLQLVAYSGTLMVGGGKVVCISSAEKDGEYFSPEYLAQVCEYTPVYNEDDILPEATIQCGFDKDGDGYYLQDADVTLKASGLAPDKFVIFMHFWNLLRLGDSETLMVQQAQYPMRLYDPTLDYFKGYAPMTVAMVQQSPTKNDTVSAEIPDGTIRSGAKITKSVLLSSENTPADYLLSFCKIFGLHFLTDTQEKKITIVTRNELYSEYPLGTDYIDLTGRIDFSQDMEIIPFVFETKWYDFALETDGGEFSESYQTQYGIQYGIQRVNTGYDFEAENVNVMDGNVFKDAVAVLERSAYFNYITVDGQYAPSVFVDKGNTYTMWNSDGETEEFNISNPPDSATVTYYNTEYPGYDYASRPKLQLHDADGKPLDGSNVLVYYTRNTEIFSRYKLTDDSTEMMLLNDNKPCWNLNRVGDAAGALQAVPVFSRYSGTSADQKALDFGRVKEFAIPDIRYGAGYITVYERCWQQYLADRYDRNTKILRCRVDLTGLPVGQELLRRFFWYDNSLWVLNKVENYSFTTEDPAQCEFIQVQQSGAYTNGQTI